MKTSYIPRNAENDDEARNALWRAICVASDDVRHGFGVKSILGINFVPVSLGSLVPDVATWKLVEALSLLGVILRSEDAAAVSINIFGKTGPIDIQEDGNHRYLWAQQTLHGEKSALIGRPDLILTSSREAPNPSNAIRIIEAKCKRKIGTQTIRSEFGKAHDLRVTTYLIWSFYSPSPKVVSGAQGLGIDLEILGFDTEDRKDFIEHPENLIYRVAYSQEQAGRNQRFAKALEKAVRRK